MVYRHRLAPRLVRLAALSVSAAALVGLALHDQVWARGTDLEPMALAQWEAEELDDALAFRDAPQVPDAEPVVGAATLALAMGADEQTQAHLPTADPARVEVPELVGLRLRAAVRELKAQGLRVSVRDEYRERVPVVAWGDYEVEGQKLDPGSLVDRGTWVRMTVAQTERFAEGY